jgi:hypothetical protein
MDQLTFADEESGRVRGGDGKITTCIFGGNEEQIL